jgi:hypothetical protein
MTLVHHKAPIKRASRCHVESGCGLCEENGPSYRVAGLVETTAQIGGARGLPGCSTRNTDLSESTGDMAGANEDPTKPHIFVCLRAFRKVPPMDRLRVLIADDKENGDSYLVRKWNFHCRRVLCQGPIINL